MKNLKKISLKYMGSYLSTPGIERLFDGTVTCVDLRSYTRTNPVNNKCNVFYVNVDNKICLFVFYLGDYWNLGIVFDEKLIDDKNGNESELLMNSGRRFLIHKNINFELLPSTYKHVDSYIINEIKYRSLKINKI